MSVNNLKRVKMVWPVYVRVRADSGEIEVLDTLEPTKINVEEMSARLNIIMCYLFYAKLLSIIIY